MKTLGIICKTHQQGMQFLKDNDMAYDKKVIRLVYNADTLRGQRFGNAVIIGYPEEIEKMAANKGVSMEKYINELYVR